MPTARESPGSNAWRFDYTKYHKKYFNKKRQKIMAMKEYEN